MNKQKIEEIWEEYFPKVYGYFFKRIENKADVEDLTSLTMIAFVSNLMEKEILNRHGLLWKIARNQFLKFLKEKYRHQNHVLSELPEHASEETEEMLVKFYRKDLHKKLESVLEKAKNTLKKEELYLVEEVYLNEKQPIEIAKEMNIKPDALRQRLKRATDKIRNLWQQII